MAFSRKTTALILSALQAQKVSYFQFGNLSKSFGLAVDQERQLIRSLLRSGEAIRLRRGQFLLRPADHRGGAWTPSEASVLKSLILDSGGQYQLCGPIAFQRYGWDDQIPNRVHVYNTLESGERKIGAVTLNLIKVASIRLGATEVSITLEGAELFWPTRARALLDAVYDWSRFNSLPRGYDWIRAELKRNPAIAADLVEVTRQYANQGTIRRIGRLLQDSDAPANLVQKLERMLRSSTSFIPWEPTQPKRGSIDRRWGVVFNHES